MRILLCCLAFALVSARVPQWVGRNPRPAPEPQPESEPEPEPEPEPELNEEVEEAFINSTIVPEVIATPPGGLATIVFGNKIVNLGNVLCAYDTFNFPYITYEADADSLYTFIYINPDIGYYYSGTLDFSYLNFLVVNIPGNNVFRGDLVSPFHSHLPYPGIGFTRNVFLVYLQPARICIDLDFLTETSRNFVQFNFTEFVEENELGDPIAGNFFLTKLTMCDTEQEEQNRNAETGCECSCHQ